VVQSKEDPKKSKKQKERYDTLAISARDMTIEREQDILIKTNGRRQPSMG
jgi:hypothetical protein